MPCSEYKINCVPLRPQKKHIQGLNFCINVKSKNQKQ